MTLQCQAARPALQLQCRSCNDASLSECRSLPDAILQCRGIATAIPRRCGCEGASLQDYGLPKRGPRGVGRRPRRRGVPGEPESPSKGIVSLRRPRFTSPKDGPELCPAVTGRLTDAETLPEQGARWDGARSSKGQQGRHCGGAPRSATALQDCGACDAAGNAGVAAATTRHCRIAACDAACSSGIAAAMTF